MGGVTDNADEFADEFNEDLLVDFRDVTFRRGGRTLVGPVTWQVELDERWVIIGPNGAGKTTLIRMAAAEEFPSGGTAFVMGEQLGRTDMRDLRSMIGISSSALGNRIPAGECISRYEAPRGEDIHYTRSNGTDKPDRVKVRAPTLANSAAIAHMLDGGYLADVPIVIAAIDPCFSCTDRMVRVTDANSGQAQSMDWESLRRYSAQWYRKQGMDFSRIPLR